MKMKQPSQRLTSIKIVKGGLRTAPFLCKRHRGKGKAL
nr:MAG TPA: hypothetical protein [Bacteriophage sp.]